MITFYRSTNEPTYVNSQYKAGQAYLLHMDRWNTLGLSENVPTYTFMNGDSLEAFDPRTKQFIP